MKNFFFHCNKIRLMVVAFVLTLSVDKAAGQQSDSVFDQAYNSIIARVATDSIPQIMASIDSLYQTTQGKEQQARILLFKGVMSVHAGHKAEALIHVLEAEKLATQANSPEWQVRAAGFLAALYREVGLISESIKHIELAERASEKLKHLPNYDIIKVNIRGERAHYENHKGNYNRAIELLKQRHGLIDNMEENSRSDFFIGNYRRLGENYLALGDYQKARLNFEKGLEIIQQKGMQSIEDIGLYRGMGEVELAAENYQAARKFLQKAESRLALNQDVEAQLMVYKSLSSLYYELGEYATSKQYNDLYLQHFNLRQKATEHIYDQLVQRSQNNQDSDQYRYGYWIAFSGIAVIILVLLLGRQGFKRRQERRKYQELIEKSQQPAPLKTTINAFQEEWVPQPEEPKKNGAMSAETQERIVADLQRMEQEHFFLDKDISIARLASELETNTKYLSSVVNQHKGQNFNAYVNELRVRYSIEKLQSDPEYRKYKIAYIAKEAGFSSHSKFTAVFKEVTGLSPSAFIAQIPKA